MPIHCPLTFPPWSDADFTEIDRAVMACVFASQNALGRLCDERVYENDLAARLEQYGYKEVYTQVPVTVSQAEFSKTYRLDLVVHGMIYELKTVAAWAPEQETRAIHYAALAGTDRVKLLNFQSAKVSGKLEEHNDYERHLFRLLGLSGLQAIQWINLNHANIEFITLRNGKGMEARE